MIDFLRKYTQKFVSRWLILLMDVVVTGFTFVLATFIRFNFDLTYFDVNLFKYHLLLVIVVRTLFFVLTKTYHGIVRHTSMEDATLLFRAVFSSTIVLLLISTLSNTPWSEYYRIPHSILLIDFFILLFSLLFIRMAIKAGYDYILRNSGTDVQKVIIYGAGLLGMIAKNTLLSNKSKNIEVL